MNKNIDGKARSQKSSLAEYLKKNNIDPSDNRDDLPCGMIYSELVPIRGSVHISSGRVISREYVDKKIKELAIA